jgi:4-hydroxy-2-oxoheptanedioate aldolase
MITNRFKARLRAGEVQFGLFSGLGDTVAPEVLATAGFDWILIDTEHAPNGVHNLVAQLQAVAAYPTDVLVRAELAGSHETTRLLDTGVQTLVVPMVESAAAAAQLVSAVRYPPRGRRGIGGSLVRATRWNRITDYVARADEEMCVVCQIESPAGVEAAASIAAVDGVDALFVGPSDLAATLGVHGQPEHPALRRAIDAVIDAAHTAGLPVGIFAPTPAAVERALEQHVTFIALGSDTALLAAAAADLAARHRRPGPRDGS